MNSPKEIAIAYSEVGVTKTKMPIAKMFVLAVFAGMFIALAGVGAAAASISVTAPSLARLVSACVFPAGLAMVIVAGSELFTGNSLIIISVLERKAKITAMLKNWIVVYIGNLVGSVLVALICTYSGVYSAFDNGLAAAVINTAAAKVSMPFSQAMLRGILCNFLVCIAVWITFAAKSVPGKIIGAFFPIMVFVLSGYEHCVANMYYVPAGLFSMANSSYLAAATADTSVITWGAFLLKNLLPVTIGNVIGGAVLVGPGYWFAYLHKSKKTRDAEALEKETVCI